MLVLDAWFLASELAFCGAVYGTACRAPGSCVNPVNSNLRQPVRFPEVGASYWSILNLPVHCTPVRCTPTPTRLVLQPVRPRC